MHTLDIKHFRLVKTIAETGNLTRAAEKLHITQPALSRQLADIEGRLGTPLFHRTRKQMLLTSAGTLVFEGAGEVLTAISRIESDIDKQVHGDSGRLCIGVHCVLSFAWLPEVLARFREIYPNVSLEIRDSGRVVEDVTGDQVDLVITSFPRVHEDVRYVDLFKDEVVAVMAPGHPLSVKRTLSERDFDGLPMIGLTEKSKDGYYRFVMKPSGVEPSVFMTIRQPRALVELVEAGMGLALLPRWAVAGRVGQGTLTAVPLAGPPMVLEWKAAVSAVREPPAFQKAFIAMMRERVLPLNVGKRLPIRRT